MVTETKDATHPGPRDMRPAGPPPSMIRDDVALAIYWCRLGRLRPRDDMAFYEAEARGYLTHANVWDTTAAGEAYLARAIFEAPYA